MTRIPATVTERPASTPPASVPPVAETPMLHLLLQTTVGVWPLLDYKRGLANLLAEQEKASETEDEELHQRLVVAADLLARGSSPDAYADACRLLGADPTRSVGLEDSPAGVASAIPFANSSPFAPTSTNWVLYLLSS